MKCSKVDLLIVINHYFNNDILCCRKEENDLIVCLSSFSLWDLQVRERMCFVNNYKFNVHLGATSQTAVLGFTRKLPHTQ